ncbi:hypothetical protein SLE2022_270130 [Rubroshorea leprosula]
MTQMWLIWWPKNISETKNGSEAGAATAAATATAATTEPSPSCYGACLRRLVRKVRKQGKAMLQAATARQQSTFQCRYDPLSYSLNFDTRMHDEDYYKFHAFSSRFAANPRTSCSTLLADSHEEN